MTFSINVTAQNVTINSNSIYLYFVTYTVAGDLKFCTSMNWTTPNANKDSANFGCASTTPGFGGGAGGGPAPVPEIITIISNKTFCGDLICQSQGNDFGIYEDFYSCPGDCPGVNLDILLSGFYDSFIRYCFDSSPSTICLNPFLKWLPFIISSIGENYIEAPREGETIYDNGQVCKGKVCEPLSGKTLIGNCFKDGPCYWDTSAAIYLLFFLLIILIVLSFVRIKKPGSKEKTNPYGYVVLRIKEIGKGRRKKKKPKNVGEKIWRST